MSWAETKLIRDDIGIVRDDIGIIGDNINLLKGDIDTIGGDISKLSFRANSSLIYVEITDNSITQVKYYDENSKLLGVSEVVEGVSRFYTEYSGKVRCVGGSYSTIVNITVYKTYKIRLGQHHYGFRVLKSVTDPNIRVDYLEEAIGMTPAYMDYSSGIFNYGSWEGAFFMPKPCMLKNDGTVDYYLDPNDYTKKADGTASDIANTSYEGNAMMQFPKIWTYSYEDSTYEYHYIASYKVSDNYHCYSNLDYAGNEIDYFYVPIYDGSLVDGKLRSLSGRAPLNSTTGTNEITYATANNVNSVNEWYIEQWCDRALIIDLLKLMSKSTDSQTAFGRGYDTGGSSAASLMNSGSMNTKGLFWGTNTGTDGVKVFGIEHFWGNIWRRTAGLMTSGTTVYVKMTWSMADGSSVTGYQTTSISGYINTGIGLGGTSGGYQSVVKATEYGTLPKTASGSSSTYETDGLWFASNVTAFADVGGSCYDGLLCGASCVDLYVAVSGSDWNIGASLSCKPRKVA